MFKRLLFILSLVCGTHLFASGGVGLFDPYIREYCPSVSDNEGGQLTEIDVLEEVMDRVEMAKYSSILSGITFDGSQSEANSDDESEVRDRIARTVAIEGFVQSNQHILSLEALAQCEILIGTLDKQRQEFLLNRILVLRGK